MDFEKYFFTPRMVTVWNSLSGHLVEAEALGVFKIRLNTGLDTIQLLGRLSSRYTLVVGEGNQCWAEWPVLVIYQAENQVARCGPTDKEQALIQNQAQDSTGKSGNGGTARRDRGQARGSRRADVVGAWRAVQGRGGGVGNGRRGGEGSRDGPTGLAGQEQNQGTDGAAAGRGHRTVGNRTGAERGINTGNLQEAKANTKDNLA